MLLTHHCRLTVVTLMAWNAILSTTWAEDLTVQKLATLLESRPQGEAMQAARKMAFQLLGKQQLLQGKAAVKVEAFSVAWAILDSEPAQVLRSDGTALGKMSALGDDGLQILIQTFPNFTEFGYQIVSSGPPKARGTLRIEHYESAPEMANTPDLPKGRLERFSWDQSRIYPKTRRNVTVYIPQSYTQGEEACLMVWQDGSRHVDPHGTLRVSTVFDHLIHRQQMPITIGVFVDPGRKEQQKESEKPANRSLEYDSLGDNYVRFLLEEILPETERRLGVRFKKAPEARAIAGGSSGGICAFTAAWERPDQFGKVLSWVGSFVDIRGGNSYPYLLRMTEKKHLRIYLLAGSHDLDNSFGHWPLANRMMESSLKFMGYDHRVDWTPCFHGSKGMAPALPDALRWLWR